MISSICPAFSKMIGVPACEGRDGSAVKLFSLVVSQSAFFAFQKTVLTDLLLLVKYPPILEPSGSIAFCGYVQDFHTPVPSLLTCLRGLRRPQTRGSAATC